MKIVGLILLCLLLSSCYTTQFTMYKPSGEQQGWKIEVINIGDSYTLKINDQIAIESSFSFLGTKMNQEGMYHDKPVQMIGYRDWRDGYNGKRESIDEIRIIIDGTEATKFIYRN